MFDFTPLVRFNVGPEFKSSDILPRNAYVTFAFGFRGPSAETTANNLNERLRAAPGDRLLLPDFIFVAEPGYMVARVTDKQFALPGQEFKQYAFLNCGADALPLFFLTLNVCLGQIRLRAVDYAALWSVLVNQLRAAGQ